MSIRYCGRGVTLYPGDRCGCCGTHYDVARVYRSDPADPGQVSVNYDGDVTIGLGGGLVEDLSTGRVELEIAPGFDVDLF